MNLTSATARVDQPIVVPRFIIDLRKEWTNVDLGPDFKVTAAIVGDRILVTRPCGFVKSADIDRYSKFILQMIADSPIQDRPYVHIKDWSGLQGGSLRARNIYASFLQSQSQLRSIVVCGCTAFLRMSLRISARFFTDFPVTKFCANIDDGIRLAANTLQLALPEHFVLKPILIRDDATTRPMLSFDPQLENHQDGTYTYQFSDNHQLIFHKIDETILYCRIEGSSPLSPSHIADIVQGRNRAILHCMAPKGMHVEIWDGANFFKLMGSNPTLQLFNTLLTNSKPLLGCIVVDAGHPTRAHYRRFWNPSAPYPVGLSTSLTSALLQAQEYLLVSNGAPKPVQSLAESRPEWTFEDGPFRTENQIVNDNIIHTICRGPLTTSRVQRGMALARQLALKVADGGKPYYMVGNLEALGDGSYQARKAFANGLRDLYREAPFRMFIAYGVKGNLLAGINLGRHKMPFRIVLSDHFENALATIQADQNETDHHCAVESRSPTQSIQQVPLPLKQYAGDILAYLGTINWEPLAKAAKPGPGNSQHPFSPVFDAIDLLKEDIAVLYHEQQKAASEQLELEAQLARSRKMEALGLLAGGVAHDLNNVLSGIVTYPDALLMELPKNSRLYDPLCVIRDCGQKAAAIVQDLLTLARRGVNHTTTLNLNTLIDEYLRSPEHRALTLRFPKIDIKTDLASDIVSVCGSTVHLKKTIMNLIFNAFEASSSSTHVMVKTENRYVDHPLKGYDTVSEGEYVVLHIIDHGSGISETDLPRIFEPFYTKKKMGRSGTGLGMAVVWGTMQDHSGYIDIKTAIGKGTTFSLYFPASQAEISLPLPKKNAPAIDGHGERILVIDDVKEQRDFASAVLHLLNYQIETVDSGEAALDYLQKGSANLVILDMIMDSGMDGLDTLQNIRKDHPDLPVIITTGYADDDRIEKTRDYNCVQMVLKPYTVQVLGEAISKALNPQSETKDNQQP